MFFAEKIHKKFLQIKQSQSATTTILLWGVFTNQQKET